MSGLASPTAKRSRFGLLEAFLCFVVFLFLIDTALQYYVSSTAASKASEEVLRQTTVAIEHKTAEIRETTEFLLLQTKSFSERKAIDFSDVRSINAFFMDHIKAHPYITSINFGDDAGNGYLILWTEDRWKNRIKKGTEAGTVAWNVTDNQGNVVSWERRKDDYDPRVRPWYINAVGSQGIRWSRPYIFRTTGDVGITASMAIEPGKGKFPGVIAADVMLKDISRFFSDLKSGNKDLSIHLVSGEQEILASSDVENLVRILRKDTSELPRIAGGGLPDLAAAVRAFGTTGSNFLSFSSSGRSFYALRRPFQFSPDLNLSLILTVPQESLLSFFGSMNRVRVILYLVMVAASGFFFASRYLAPLRKLTRAAQTFGTGAYDPLPLSGRKDEIGVLVSEFSRMADDLSAKQKELTSLINNVPGIVYRGHPDWSISFIRAEVEQVTGHSSSEFTTGAARWKEIIHPEDIGWLKETFRKAVREKSATLHVEYRICRTDGGIRWIADRRQLIYSESGDFAYVDGLLLDVTEFKKVEEKLLESEDRYRDLVEHSQDLICTHDLKGRLLSVNPWAARIVGYSQDELLRMNMRDVIAPEVHSEFDKYLGDIGKNGTARGMLLIRTRSDERRIWEYNNTLRTEGVTEPIVRGMAQDVTERMRMEKALRETTRRLQLAATSGGFGIWEWDIQSDALHWDDRMFELYGIPRDTSLKGVERWHKYLHPDDYHASMEASQAAIRGEKEYDVEFRVVRPDAKVRALHANAVVIRDADGNAVRMIGINSDITERRNLEGQLRQAMKMEAVGRLAGGVAHDFNNLLTAIMGNVSLAIMKLPPSDPVEALLDEVKKAAERAARLTQQLLAFSRKQIIEPKILNINAMIADLNKMLARLIGEHIEMKTLPGKDLGMVKFDAGQFEQVMVNLAVNARDAMPDGGKLIIETANVDLDDDYCATHRYVSPGRFVLLAVSDTGHGMNDEVKRQIFEPFFTTKSKGSGTGLGLSTIYGAVKQSGGSIEVYSEEGKGTTFKIFLPRVEGDAGRTGSDDGPQELMEGSETVLLVEDEDIVRRLCVKLLERLGYTVLKASGGDEAIGIAKGHPGRIDLLMTDVVMPGMNGRELAERLVEFHPETKVLFASGYTDDAIVHHGVLNEGVAFIGKPYTLSALAKKVRDVLDKA